MYKKELLERANSLKKSVTKLIEHSGKTTFPSTISTPLPTLQLVCYRFITVIRYSRSIMCLY